MALTKVYDTQYGVQAPDAYILITDFKGTLSSITCKVGVWYDEAAYLGGYNPLECTSHTFPFTDGMGVSDLYLGLQNATAEYADAVDHVSGSPA